MRERRGRRGIGVVVGGNVDGLHGRDRALLGRGDALLQFAHLGGQVRLVSDGRRHAAEQRRYFRAGLREAENVVDEQQHVLPFFVAEILGDGQAGQTDAQARPGRLGHLAVDQRALRFRVIVRIDDARFLHFEPQVVAFARALAHAGEHRHTAVFHGDVVDQFHDDDGLADAGAAEQADLAAAKVGLEQVDDLDAGLEHLQARWTALRTRAPGGESGSASCAFTGPMLSTGSPITFSTRPSVSLPTGTVTGWPRLIAFMPRTRPSVGCSAMVRTRPSPMCCATSQIMSIGVGHVEAFAGDADRGVDERDLPFGKLNVDGGPGDLDHFADYYDCR